MKLTTLIITFSIVSVFASGTYSQTKELSLNAKDSPLKEVLQDIEDQSEFYFMYSEKIIDVNRKVSVNIKNTKVKEILDRLFSGTDVNYLIEDRFILLTTPEVSGKKLNSVQSIVSGVVTDNDGVALPGVTVVVKGSTVGTITDINGKYSLNVDVADENLTLVFSFVGMITEEVIVGNQSTINISLVPDIIGLEELIVVGYGMQRKSDLTGAVGSIKSEQLKEIPLARVDQALQGKMAGVSVSTTDGSPGGNVKIRIRGANSINGQNEPLVVVDGFLGGDLKTINPSDIESIEVLKDASATAIYGSRGANGVILVTTKKGKEGKSEININSYVSSHKLGNTIETLDAFEYANMVNERNNAFGRRAYFSDEEIENFRINGGTNWEDEIYRKYALVNNTKISVLGGTEKARYYLSANVMGQEGLIEKNNFSRIGIVSNMDADVNDRVEVGMNISTNKETNRGVESSGYWGNAVDNALRFSPTTPVYDENGDYAQEQPITINGAWNPVATVFEPRRLATTYNGLINSYAKIKLFEGLTFKMSYGVKIRKYESDIFQNLETLTGQANQKNIASHRNNTDASWQHTNTLNYIKSFNDIHRFNATMVYEQQHNEYKEIGTRVGNFATESLGFWDLNGGSEKLGITSGHYDSHIHSFLGRVNYSFLDRYLVTISYRADGSSKFGKDQKWAYFPSGSLAWRLSQEEFIQNLGVFSNLKLRTSYGVTGSQAINPYQTLAQLDSDNPYPIDGSNIAIGIGPSIKPENIYLQWEKTYQGNIGVDMGFFNDRLALAVDLYQKNTKDLLLYEPMAAYTGYKEQMNNVGEVSNKGLEILVTASPLISDFKWDVSMNLSANKTEVVKLGRGEDIILGTTYSGSNREYIISEGEELGTFYGYQFQGVWTEDEAAEAALYGNMPGDPKYLDANNDSTINSDDKIVLGSGQAKFRWGLTNSFKYKGFDMSFDILGVHGNKILNVRRYLLNQAYRLPENQEYYTTENQNTNVPSIESSIDRGTADSRWLEDGSFVRLRNVTFGYTLKKNWVQKIKLSSVRFYVSGQNLLTFTNYSGFDPELSSSGNSDTMIGYDASAYPSAKIFTFGVDVKF